MEPETVDQLINALKLARDEVTRPNFAMQLESTPMAIRGKTRQS